MKDTYFISEFYVDIAHYYVLGTSSKNMTVSVLCFLLGHDTTQCGRNY
jgi:hypothetical protein